MGNLSILTPKDFAEDHHKKRYKELGWAQVRISIQKGSYCITEPYEWPNRCQYEADADGKYIVWQKNEPIAEFKYSDHAMNFLTSLELEENKRKRKVGQTG